LGQGVGNILSLGRLLNKSFSSMSILIAQKKRTNLPYYGPIARGWLGDALYENKELWEVLFKNPHVDVRPYFFYTYHYDESIELHFEFIGFSEIFIKELAQSLESKIESHIGGVDCEIKNIRIAQKKMSPLDIDRRFRLKFVSPLALERDGNLQLSPNLNDIFASIVRSVNRFCKYYLKRNYPIRVRPDLLKSTFEPIDAEIKPYVWRHRNSRGNVLPLRGIMGWAEYEIDGHLSELEKVLRLTQVFQVGKWVSYGFGKLEVERVEN